MLFSRLFWSLGHAVCKMVSCCFGWFGKCTLELFPAHHWIWICICKHCDGKHPGLSPAWWIRPEFIWLFLPIHAHVCSDVQLLVRTWWRPDHRCLEDVQKEESQRHCEQMPRHLNMESPPSDLSKRCNLETQLEDTSKMFGVCLHIYMGINLHFKNQTGERQERDADNQQLKELCSASALTPVRDCLSVLIQSYTCS